MQKTRAELLELFSRRVADWLARFPAEVGVIRKRVCAALEFSPDEFRDWILKSHGKAAVDALESHVANVKDAPNAENGAVNSSAPGEKDGTEKKKDETLNGNDDERPFLPSDHEAASASAEGDRDARDAALWLDKEFDELLRAVGEKKGAKRAAAVEYLFRQIAVNLRGRSGAVEALVREKCCDELKELKKADYDRCMREAKAKIAANKNESQAAAADGDNSDWAGLARKFILFDGVDHALIFWRETWYQWTRESGFYDEKSKAWIHSRVMMWLIDGGKNVDERSINNLIGVIRGMSFLDDASIAPSWLRGVDGKIRRKKSVYISLRNGILDLESVQFVSDPAELSGERIEYAPLIPHTPDFFTLNSLPYEFDPKAVCPQLDAALQTWQPIDKNDPDGLGMRLLQDFAGYIFEPGQPHQVMLLNYGPGSDGKSQYKDLLIALAGVDNTTALGLEALDPSNTNGREDLLGRTLWTVPDANQIEKMGEGSLKAITGGDRVSIGRKFKPAITVHVDAKVVLNCNELPGFKDRSEGIWRRILMLHWRPVVGKIIRNFASVLIDAEMPGIFNWALRGWRRVRECGFARRGVIVENVQKFRRETQHEFAFFDQCVEVMIEPDWEPKDTAEAVSMEKLLASFMNWCKRNNIKPYPHPETMGRALSKWTRWYLERLEPAWTAEAISEFLKESSFTKKRTEAGKQRIRYYVKVKLLEADIEENERDLGVQYGATRSAPLRPTLYG